MKNQAELALELAKALEKTTTKFIIKNHQGRKSVDWDMAHLGVIDFIAAMLFVRGKSYEESIKYLINEFTRAYKIWETNRKKD